MMENNSKMTPTERQASISLALVFALRMLGLFILIPIFSVHAQSLPDGNQAFLIGLAFGFIFMLNNLNSFAAVLQFPEQ